MPNIRLSRGLCAVVGSFKRHSAEQAKGWHREFDGDPRRKLAHYFFPELRRTSFCLQMRELAH